MINYAKVEIVAQNFAERECNYKKADLLLKDTYISGFKKGVERAVSCLEVLDLMNMIDAFNETQMEDFIFCLNNRGWTVQKNQENE